MLISADCGIPNDTLHEIRILQLYAAHDMGIMRAAQSERVAAQLSEATWDCQLELLSIRLRMYNHAEPDTRDVAKWIDLHTQMVHKASVLYHI